MGARSKGCITCKARKIKCSEQRPSCQQCRKANLECGGYKAVLRFVDEAPRIERRKTVEKFQQKDFSQVSILIQRNSSPHSTPQQPKLIISNNKAIYQDGFVSYLVMKLKNGRNCLGDAFLYPNEHVLPGGDPGTWVAEASKRPSKSLFALAAMFFGQAYQLQDIIVSSLSIYGAALAEIRQGLVNGRGVLDFNILASTTLLCMFELSQCREGSGWLFHAQFLERLMEAKGPPRDRKSPDHFLFLEQRMILISQAIVSQKSTILSQKRWKLIPWEDDPSSKVQFDFLLDIICDILGYRADLKASQEGNYEAKNGKLKHQAIASLAELDDWWREWERIKEDMCWEVETNPLSTRMNDSTGLLYPTVVEYSDVWIAFMVCTYDSARIMLLNVLAALVSPEDLNQTSSLPTYESRSGDALLGLSSDSEGLAHEILRSIDYCSNQMGHFMGGLSAILILDVAYGALRTSSRHSEWLLKNGAMDVARSRKQMP